jgi:NAD/NADP transhydrogenase beta subunit
MAIRHSSHNLCWRFRLGCQHWSRRSSGGRVLCQHHAQYRGSVRSIIPGKLNETARIKIDSQATARAGNALGMLGVFAGIVATLAAVGFTEEQMGQFAMLVVAGGGLGLAIGRRVSPMQLPQTVAALHSVVGLAAVMTSAGSVLGSDPEHLTTLHLTTAYLGVLIGGVTFTGMSIQLGITDLQDLSWHSSSLVVECRQSPEYSQEDISSILHYSAPICYR